MYVQSIITPPPAAATADQVEVVVDRLYTDVSGLVHRLHYLMADLERCFSYDRAQERKGQTLTFRFQESGIDAMQWLSAEAWNKAVDLKDGLANWQKQFDDARVLADRRAAA